MAGIPYRAIYKNTTIDPPGTIKHAIEMGAEIVRPKHSFFELISEHGLPNRFRRFCCQHLKEYKILDKSVIGVRKAESVKRASRYQEPVMCRFYGSKKNRVETFLPILEWTDDDVAEFIQERGIKCHHLYYDDKGHFHKERRLGCMGCPLASKKKRIQFFKENPKYVRAYIRAAKKLFDNGKNCSKIYRTPHEYFARELFYKKQCDWNQDKNNLFGTTDYKKFLEEYFKIDLTI